MEEKSHIFIFDVLAVENVVVFLDHRHLVLALLFHRQLPPALLLNSALHLAETQLQLSYLRRVFQTSPLELVLNRLGLGSRGIQLRQQPDLFLHCFGKEV